LQAAAITYRIAFGPRAVQKLLTLRGAMPRQGTARQPLCADTDGFSLHAAVRDLRPHEALAIEDSAVGVAAARSAGIPVLAVKSASTSRRRLRRRARGARITGRAHRGQRHGADACRAPALARPLDGSFGPDGSDVIPVS